MAQDSFEINNYIAEGIENFNQLGSGQKIGVLTLIAFILTAVIVGIIWLKRPDYRALYSDLDLKDVSAVTKMLKEEKIPYKLTDGGTTILVPQRNLYQMRTELAGKNLPGHGKIGFEIFDKSDFKSSDFTERVKYVRALQGELSSTIEYLDSVDEARVNLQVPKNKIYANEEERPSASIVLQLAAGATLRPEEIRGIAKLVCGALEGLQPSDVTIMDTDGNLLSQFLENDNMGFSGLQTQRKREFEKDLEEKVKSLLDKALGVGKAIVKVDVTLEFNEKKVSKETYEPSDGNTGVIKSSQTVSEDYKDLKIDSKTNAVLGNSPDYSQKTVNADYEINKTQEDLLVTPGAVKRMCVGVLVDAACNLNDEKITDLNQIIKTVTGFSNERGDEVTIKTISFERPKTLTDQEPDQKTAGAAPALIPGVPQYVYPVVIGVMFLAFIVGKLRTRRGKEKKTVPRAEGKKVDIVVSDGGEKREGAPDETTSEEDKLAKVEKERHKITELKEQARNLVADDPHAVARIAELWLMEDRG